MILFIRDFFDPFFRFHKASKIPLQGLFKPFAKQFCVDADPFGITSQCILKCFSMFSVSFCEGIKNGLIQHFCRAERAASSTWYTHKKRLPEMHQAVFA